MDAGFRDTVGAEVLTAAHQADGELGVDCAFRDAEFLGDFAMGEPLDSTQRDNLGAARRKGTHGVGQQFEFLFMAE
jgi:hypothetical protein